MKDVKAELTKTGDLGVLAAQSKRKQSVLSRPKPLSVQAVYQGFKAIAMEKGNKSMDKKVGGRGCVTRGVVIMPCRAMRQSSHRRWVL